MPRPIPPLQPKSPTTKNRNKTRMGSSLQELPSRGTPPLPHLAVVCGQQHVAGRGGKGVADVGQLAAAA
jgi:hypothetical protein